MILFGGNGGNMAIPDINWNQLEQIAKTDSELQSALDIVTARMPERPPRTTFGQADDDAKALLLAHEGDKFDTATQRHYVYEDSAGNPTIGYGHLISNEEDFSGGITDDEALALFDQDFQIHKDILFAELGLNEAVMFADSVHSDVDNDWAYAWAQDNIEYEGGSEIRIEVAKNGDTQIFGFNNREEVLAAGQARYEEMPNNVQAAVLSVTYNYGTTGPQTIREVNKAIDTENFAALATHYTNVLAKESGGDLVNRRRDEANLIRTGQSVQVRQSAEMQGSTLNRIGVPDVFAGQNMTGFARGSGMGTRSPSEFNVGQQIMEEQSTATTTAERDPMTGDEFNQVAKSLGLGVESPLLPEEVALGEQYGAFGMFMYERDQEQDLLFGIDVNGNVVPYNDESAIFQQSLVGYLESGTIQADSEQSINTIIPSLLRNTKWGMENNSLMREFDVDFARLSEVDRLEFLQATIDSVDNALRGLGYELTDDEVYNLALDFQRLNGFVTEANTDKLFKQVFAAVENKEMTNELTSFQGLVEENLKEAGNYYLNMTEEQARDYAEQMLSGDLNTDEFQQILQDMAKVAYPHLEGQATELGVSPKGLFANTEAAIERLLGKTVDLRDSKWNPILSYVDPSSNKVRAMTTWEAENYVRTTDDYLDSNEGQNKIYNLVDGLAQAFGRL